MAQVLDPDPSRRVEAEARLRALLPRLGTATGLEAVLGGDYREVATYLE